MKFSEVAEYFEAIEQTSSRLEMTQLLTELLDKATPEDARIICNIALGQLHPPHIGTQFNVAEKNLIKVVAQLTNQSVDDVKKKLKHVGDLGLMLEDGNWRSADAMTVQQVYDALDVIEKISGTGSQEEKNNEITKLLHALEPFSAKYVLRIIVGKLRLGFSAMTIVDALSWMVAGNKSLRATIENAYNICADIGFIAQTLKEKGIGGLEKMHIHVGVPIVPAAAERLPTARAIFEKIGNCIAQPKLDGFRLQVHLDNTQKEPRVFFFSRNLSDMSYMFPDLTKAVAALPVKTLICEGEAIVYDTHTQTFLPFQETVKRKRKHGIKKAAEEMPLQLFLFDLLYLDGSSYLSATHAERRKKLLAIFNGIKSTVVRPIEEKKIESAEQLEAYFNSNISAGLEGLVVKKEDSVYQPGKRNFNWIKLKRQEEGQLDDTIDCVILGYYAGAGKRAQFGIGAFLVGIYNKKEDRFQTIAKVGTGLKDADWKELKKKCDMHAVSAQPKDVQCDKSLIPDVWVLPEIVCLIRADEITLSPVHTAAKTTDQLGFALRFPRFMGYRPDKKAVDATSASEIKKMYAQQFER